MSRSISLVVLAAGSSRRFGLRNKLLEPIHGEPMVRHVVRTAMAAPVDEVLVVLGHEAEQVGAAIDGLSASHRLGLMPRRVLNPDYEKGQSTSVRAGIQALGPGADAVIFLPGDQVGVSEAFLQRIVAPWRRREGSVVVPVCDGQRRSPVLFARQHFHALAALHGDAGGRLLLPALEEETIEVEAESREIRDVDTERDLNIVLLNDL